MTPISAEMVERFRAAMPSWWKRGAAQEDEERAEVRAALEAALSGEEGETGSHDFQIMLARICYRARKGRDLAPLIEMAADLLRRKGTLSPLREGDIGHNDP